MATLASIEAPVDTGFLDAAAVSAFDALMHRDRVSESEVSQVLRTIRQSINRLQAMELTAISLAQRSQMGTADGMTGVSAWVARESRQTGAEAARNVRLAALLEGLPNAETALGEGLISVQHAQVIADATKQLPPDLDPSERAQVEAALTEQAKRVDPTTLRKTSRRAIEIAGRSVEEADAHENQMVRTAEEVALLKTKLSMHDNDDGTTVTGYFTVPTFAGSILRKAVQQITAPRRATLRSAHEDGRTWIQSEDSAGDWTHKYGLALVELLEHLPTDRLHTKVAATVVVTMDVEQLRAEVVAAGVAAPGLKVAHTDIGVGLSAGKARQLACNAGLVPAVLNGASVPLDLGRTNRFFSEGQRTMLASKYETCAAAGCDRPYSWSELHHQHPWQHGGDTDLDQAIPLCWFHHRKIHDPGFVNTITAKPGGTKRVIFRQRT